ncbi:MAG: hypothetical protein KBT04_05865 [Bacteroidales bacterium]|nr:hypothetical protein [Candidatus Colimorpha onthohippi]
MKRSRINVLKRYIDIQRLTKQHYVEGLTTYSGLWRFRIEPIYHISYQQYMRILGIGGLEAELEREQQRLNIHSNYVDPELKNQLNLFDQLYHETDND